MSKYTCLPSSLILEAYKNCYHQQPNFPTLSSHQVTNTTTFLLHIATAQQSQQLQAIQKFCGEHPQPVQSAIDICIVSQFLLLKNRINGQKINLKGYNQHLSSEKWHGFVQYIICNCDKPFLQDILTFFTDFELQKYLKQPTDLAFQTFKCFMQNCPQQMIEQLTVKYGKEYLSFIDEEDKRKSLTHKKIFLHLKLLELTHVANPNIKIGHLGRNQHFIQNVLFEGMRDFQTNGASALVANIYGGILKQMGVYDAYIQSFFDVYLILDCYGAHLVKDVWDNFYTLAEGVKKAQLTYLIPIWKLLHCLLQKVQSHTNHNVSKYCIQSLLTAKPSATTTLFQCLPNTVYSSLVQILNNGTHYHDCVFFHQDSKMYPIIQQFYLQAYNRMSDAHLLRTHVRLLVSTMHEYITFEHCIIAYSGILCRLPAIHGLLSVESLKQLGQIINRLYGRLTVRKRHLLINEVLTAIMTSLEQVPLAIFMNSFALGLPLDAIKQYKANSAHPSLPFLYQIIVDRYGVDAIEKRINQLKQSEECGLINITVEIMMLESILALACSKFWNQSLIQNILSKDLSYLAVATYATPQQYQTTITLLKKAIDFGLQPIIITYLQANSITVQNLLMTLSQAIMHPTLSCQICACIETVSKCIKISSSENPSCRHFTKFIQLCVQKCQNSQKCQPYINTLLYSIKYKLQNTTQYRSIQQCFYQLFHKITHNELSHISPKDSLRIQLILISILSHDKHFIHKLLMEHPKYIDDLPNFCEIYDFEHYEELFCFITTVCKAYHHLCQKQQRMGGWHTFMQQLCTKTMKQTIESMLHNLDYGVKEKQVVSSTRCILNMAQLINYNKDTVDLLEFVLNIGERYWGFQRQIVFGVLDHFQIKDDAPKIAKSLSGLLQKMVEIEEYRGQDSAIILQHHSFHKVYLKKLLDPEADFDGTALRLSVINWGAQVLQILVNNQSKQQQIKVWLHIFDDFFRICMKESVKQKMFLTGGHKTKLKYWQFLLVFPEFLIKYHPCLSKIVLQCFQSMSHNNLSEIRHYSEIFMMKLIVLPSNNSQIIEQLSEELRQKLLSIYGQTNLNKNIAYMLVGGLTLQIKYDRNLYSALFVSVCSHIAYYRGLSQYFCFNLLPKAREDHVEDLHFVQSLYQEYLRDEDALKLSSLLEIIVEKYKKLIRSWNIWDNLLKEKPTLNGQIVSHQYYIEQFKNIGQQLVKENKNEDGFMQGKDIWKKLIRNQTQNKESEMNEDDSKEMTSFQRKIDPSLDDIYSFTPIGDKKINLPQTRILVVSAERIALYGHLARVSEIMGVQQLCIPNKNITSMEDFYNVSVTAENWLNITEHKFQKIIKVKAPLKKIKKGDKKHNEKQNQQYEMSSRQTLDRIIQNLIIQNYTIYKVGRTGKYFGNGEITKFEPTFKSLLIIDQLNLLGDDLKEYTQDREISFGQMYSSHVQATLFIWETFKRFVCVEN